MGGQEGRGVDLGQTVKKVKESRTWGNLSRGNKEGSKMNGSKSREQGRNQKE